MKRSGFVQFSQPEKPAERAEKRRFSRCGADLSGAAQNVHFEPCLFRMNAKEGQMRVAFTTLGCKVSQYETENLSELFAAD